MSYITMMGVAEGVIMSADRQITQRTDMSRLIEIMGGPAGQALTELINERLKPFNKTFTAPLTRTARKLFAMGDNIGVCMGKAMYSENGILMSIFVDHFCRTHTFDKPREAAEKLLEHLCKAGGDIDTFLYLAGFDKSEPETASPEMYHLSLEKKSFSGGPDLAFYYGGYNEYFKPFADRINDRETKAILRYTLQDAIDISKFAIDTSRFLCRYFDFEDAISDDIEMIAITHNGIQWLRKAELEVR